MVKKFILAAVMLVSSVVPFSKKSAGVDDLVSEFRSQTKCGSVSVVVYDKGEFSYYGDAESLYQIGSMTKAFTGLAVQKLISSGKLSKEDKVSDLIPGFTAYFGSSETDITVENLLMQRSGYTNNENDYPAAKEGETLAEWASEISGKQLKSKPGTEYEYSNVNYNLLGLITEKVTGMSYREYMEKEILIPLGLSAVSAGKPADENSVIGGTRLGFRNVFGYETPVREGSIPAGYFYSNTADIGRWLKAWIENKDPDMDAVLENLNEKGDYYAGWERAEGDVIGHSGGTPNYSSRIVFSRSKGTGVCVLTNLNVASTTDSLCNSIFAELTGSGNTGLACDVWTVFDIIFTSVSAVFAALLLVIIIIRKKGLLAFLGSLSAILTALVLILFPVIFGADIRSIAFTWAPWSFLSGIILMAACAAGSFLKLITVKVNEGRTKTG
ncbi:MAG: beta-lactamase family protein [Clostridiales bacterium]|nr:beta-lactamase family protein [Clostridiales bacterium]